MSSRPVIIGVDGDAAARDAMALGDRLAQLLGTSLEPVTVTGGHTAEALGETAAGRHAAAIVLGPTHHHALGRTLRGTARRLLAEAPCPVAVAPAGFADRTDTPLRRIGVGYEPTPEGRRALETAHDLAVRAGGSLLALGAALPLSPLAVDDLRDRTPYLEEERRSVQTGLERALAELPPGVPAVAEAHVGDPAVELTDASTELDLLVCGSRRRGPARAALLGSVTERLLRMAACPVLIVPGEPSRRVRRPRTMPSMVLPPPRG